MNRKHKLWILPALLWCATSWAAPSDSRPCGTTGTLQQRMKNCGETGMRLVTVDSSGNVIKMDDTGLLWGDLLEGTYTFKQAKEACKNVTVAQGYPPISGVREKWRVPKPEEFAHIGRKKQEYFNKYRTKFPGQKDIEGNGTWNELPNMDHWFWSSSGAGLYYGGAWVFYGSNGYVVGYFTRYNYYSVRCVAR